MVSVSKGRRTYLTQDDKDFLVKFLKPDPFNKSAEDFRDMVQSLVDERMDEELKGHVAVSDRYLYDLEQELGIQTGGAEETTDARAAAVADKRNSFAFAAMSSLVSQIVKRALILNADATQYTVGYDSKSKVKVKYIEKINGAPLKVLPVKDNNGGVLFTIKYYLLIGAAGEQSDPIFIIADDNMGPEDIDAHKIPELAVHTHPDSTAYVVFCKTRCCNAAFYKWFVVDVLFSPTKH